MCSSRVDNQNATEDTIHFSNMLENIRKYNMLMIIVMVLLALGLIFTFSTMNKGGASPGSSVVTVNGEGVTNKEFIKITRQTEAVVNQFKFLRDREIAQIFEPMELLSASSQLLASDLDIQDRDMRFAVARIIVRQECKKHGIFIDLAGCEKVLKEKVFITEEGEFDATNYNAFVENVLSELSLTEKGFLEIVQDCLCLNRLREIKTGRFSVPAHVELKNQILAIQSVKAKIAQLDMQSVLEEINPSDAEIKEHWEITRDGDAEYKTDLKMRFSFIKIMQDTIKAPAKLSEKDASNSTLKETHEMKLEKYASDTEARRKKLRMIDDQFADFEDAYTEAIDSNKDTQSIAFFKQHMKSSGIPEEEQLKVTASELLNKQELDTLFNSIKLRKTEQGSLSDFLYSGSFSVGDERSLAVEPDGYLFFYVEEVIDPELKTFEDAKPYATKTLKEKLAREKIAEQAEKLREKAVKLMADGKSIQEVGTELNITFKSVTGLNERSQFLPDTELSPNQLYAATELLDHKAVSEVITTDDVAGFAIVENRTREPIPNYIAAEAGVKAGHDRFIKQQLFTAWLLTKINEAKINGIAKTNE